MAGVDYSKVAVVYRWLESCVFGQKLQRARVALLGDVFAELQDVAEPRVLLVGDGDGRFCEALLEAHARVKVDYVDLSEGMLRRAQKRVRENHRVRWNCVDVREWHDGGYDVVVAHFFLDGFEGEERVRMVRGLLGRLRDGGLLCLSDFDPAVNSFRALFVRVMQVFFALVAGERFVNVVRNDALLYTLSGMKISEKAWQKGWIYTQLWKF